MYATRALARASWTASSRRSGARRRKANRTCRRISGSRAKKPACQAGFVLAAELCRGVWANAIMGDLLDDWTAPARGAVVLGGNTAARATRAGAKKEGLVQGADGATEMNWMGARKPNSSGP